MTETQTGTPDRPPVVILTGTWTTHYAVLDRTVGFDGRGRIFVGHTLLGRVPRLAIAHDGDRWILLHCRRSWKPRAVTGDYRSLSDAQAAAQRRYPGSAARWHATGYTKARADACVARASRDHRCSFCGRRPDEVAEQMFVAKRNAASVCDACVDGFAALRAKYRRQQDASHARLLSPVSTGRWVDIALRSHVLVLLDLAAFQRHREALLGMAALDETGRRRALAALATPGIGVTECVPFTPGAHRIRPADLIPARRREAGWIRSRAAAWSSPTWTPCRPSPPR